MRTLVFSILLFIEVTASARPLNLSVAAPAAILINAENGKILFAKNIDDQYFPGSVTKIATCLLALQRITNLDEQVKAPLECLIHITHKVKKERHYQDPSYWLEPDGTSFGIYTGEWLSMKDLLYGAMLPSGNDAANVLAHRLSDGDIPAYVEDMNRYLQTIGCRNTKFYNPHGLHHPKHVTTARDLALLGKEAIKHPIFLEIIGTVQYERPKTNKQPARTVWTHNRLLRKGKFHYPKAFGIKTGYHAAAGCTFVAAAKDGARTLIAVVLHAANREELLKDTIKMFDAAFEEKILGRQLLNAQEKIFTTKLQGAKHLLQASLREDLSISYYPSEEEDIQPHLVWYDLELPIKQGDQVGELQVITVGGEILKTAYIYALHDIHRSIWKEGWEQLNSWKSALWLVGILFGVTGIWLYRKYGKSASCNKLI